MTLLGALRVLGLRLWDESSKKLLGFRHLKQAKEAEAQEEQDSRKNARP